MSGAAPPLLELAGVDFFRPTPEGGERAVLRGVDLRLEAGECLLLVGPSGGGKSSLLGLAAGLYPAWGGRAAGVRRWRGRDSADWPAAERVALIGFCQQNPERQFLHATVAQELGCVARNRGWPAAEVEAAVAGAATRLGLAGLLDRPPHALSGGQQVLVAFGCILAARPPLVILDETLAHLDPANARLLGAALLELKAAGCGIVASEHRDGFPAGLVDGRLVLADGRLAPAEGRLRPGYPGIAGCAAPGAGAAPGNAATAGGAADEESAPHAARPSAAPGGRARLLARDLTVLRGGRPLLRGLRFRLAPGETIVLRGANGCGKSSLLRALAGFENACRGRLLRRGGLRLVAQQADEGCCRPTVRAELAFEAGRRRRRGLPAVDAEVWLARAGLAAAADRSPFTLSEGERRRLALLCAIASGADILLLDEVLAGLDPASAERMCALVGDFLAGGGAVLAAAHDDAFQRRFAARVLELDGLAAPPDLSAPPRRTAAARPEGRTGTAPGRHMPFRRGWLGWLAFFGLLAVELCPWPAAWRAAALALVLASYATPGSVGRLPGACRRLFLFSLVPGLVFLAADGWQAAVRALLLINLLVASAERLAGLLDWGALTRGGAGGRFGLLGFALGAALAQLPAWRTRIARCHGTLRLRLGGRPGGWTGPRLAGLLFVPVCVQMVVQAEALGMNLDQKGFAMEKAAGKDGRAHVGAGTGPNNAGGVQRGR